MGEEHIKVYVAAGVMIEQGGKYLLVQEKKPIAFGLWNWPGGRVEKGYSFEQTAIKEAKEEAGYDVEIIRSLGFFHGKEDAPVQHLFLAKVIGGDLNISEEMLDAKWFSEEEIRSMKEKLRFEWILGGLDMINGVS